MAIGFSDFFDQALVLPKVLDFNAKAEASLKCADDFLAVYPSLLEDLDVKQGTLGQFHTKENIVDIVLDSLPINFIERIASGAKLLDPSCGTANFLIHVVERAIAFFQEKGLPPEEAINSVNEKVIPNLAGAEIDPVLLRAACLNFEQKFGGKIRPPVFHEIDSLDLEDEKATDAFGGKFDYVIGNPPWVEVKRLPDRIKEAVQEIYSVSNLYGAFVIQGVNFLKAGGALSYIVPRSFTGGRYFFRLRELLSKETSIQKISYYTNRNQEFYGGDVLQEIVVISLEKLPPAEDHLVSCLPCVDIDDFHDGSAFQVRQTDLFSHHDLMMLLARNQQEFGWIKKISAFPNFEEHGLAFSTGQLVLHRVKDYLKAESAPGCYRIIYGHDILNEGDRYSFQQEVAVKKDRFPYATTKGRKNFDGRRTQKGYAATESSIETYCNRFKEIIICRRRSHKGDKRRFVGIYLSSELPNGFFLENGLNYIVAKKPSPTAPSLKVFYRIMRSDLFERYFQIVSSNTQLNKNDMYLFGIPKVGPDTQTMYQELEAVDGNDVIKINCIVESLYSV
ncbi:MAG: hypothetical protein FJ146_12290 [Deltaproteobacteria bacterium]|nr:hypothetical protein [Deltaproteobacteria bacterium]